MAKAIAFRLPTRRGKPFKTTIMINFRRHKFFTSIIIGLLTVGTVLIAPISWAQDATQSGQVAAGASADAGSSSSTNSTSQTASDATNTGANAGSDQGTAQGTNQGTNQGGPTLSSLGLTPDQNGHYDTSALGANDPRAGANQGTSQGTNNGVPTPTPAAATPTPAPTVAPSAAVNDPSATNTGTGANSNNNSSATTNTTDQSQTNNTGSVTNNNAGAATTGQSSSTQNTGPGSVSTGNAGVGVQQVTADNLNTSGSSGEIQHTTTAGSQNGDVILNFQPNQSGSSLGQSFRSVNSVTGADSTNNATVNSTTTQLNEIQNDGQINNTLNASAVTGQNDATQNTGNASISTGNANVAATLINFLNSNVVDSNLWLEVTDILGNLNGNVVIPPDVVAILEKHQRDLLINAVNSGTGSNSQNTTDVNVNNTQNTIVANDAYVKNNINVDGVTGQNTATQNTGNSTINTGNVNASANTVTLANTNVDGGSLGVIIVNALNKWLGFLVGQDGSITPISHDYTTQLVAQNSQTGADSTNNSSANVNNSETNVLNNDGKITNTLNLDAITGQNTANQNTGTAQITTGNANVEANVVNVVNTNVIHGNLFVAVVNVLGNWMGNLLFGNQNLGALAGAGTDSGSAAVAAQNSNTGADSTNSTNVALNNQNNVDIQNHANIENDLHVNADTGHNQTDRNTGLGSIKTGDAIAVLHARNIANITVASVAPTWSDITAALENAVTGTNSQNTIDVTVNDQRNINVTNDAHVDTAMGAIANTGFNTANRNTLGGAISTGIAEADAFVANLLNQTWLVGGTGSGNVVLSGNNNQTGSGSTNSTDVSVNLGGTANVSNNADVNNQGEMNANSGNNQANDNTGNGTVAAGAAGVNGGADNNVNHTQLAGDPAGLNVVTDNNANIANDFGGSANSGGNETDRNTGGGAGTGGNGGDGGNGGGNDGGATTTDGGSGNGNGGSGGDGDHNGGGANTSGSGGSSSAKTKVAGATTQASDDNGIGGGDVPTYFGRVAQAATTDPAKMSPRFPVAGLYNPVVTRSVLKFLPWALLALALGLFARIYFSGRNSLVFLLTRRRKNI